MTWRKRRGDGGDGEQPAAELHAAESRSVYPPFGMAMQWAAAGGAHAQAPG